MNIYQDIPQQQIKDEKSYLTSAIFKLLPYKEEKYSYLDNYFESVIQRLIGFNRISGNQPEVLTIIELLEYARTEDEYSKYRKSILDACSLVKAIKEVDSVG